MNGSLRGSSLEGSQLFLGGWKLKSAAEQSRSSDKQNDFFFKNLTASFQIVFSSCRSVSQRVNPALQTQGKKTAAAILEMIMMLVINAAYLVFRSWFSSS